MLSLNVNTFCASSINPGTHLALRYADVLSSNVDYRLRPGKASDTEHDFSDDNTSQSPLSTGQLKTWCFVVRNQRMEIKSSLWHARFTSRDSTLHILIRKAWNTFGFLGWSDNYKHLATYRRGAQSIYFMTEQQAITPFSLVPNLSCKHVWMNVSVWSR